MSSRTSNVVAHESVGHVLCVVGPNVAAVVGSIGGWLFDHSMAGWRVTAVVDGDDDVRPLRVLGVSTATHGVPWTASHRGPGRRCLAVATDSFEADPGVRSLVLEALDDHRTDVALWGGELPPTLNRRLAKVQHRVGAGAAAFKRQALAAVTPNPSEDLLEVFHANACWRTRADAVQLESLRAINDSGHGGMQ